MARIYSAIVRQASTTVGTGAYTVAGTVTGHQTFADRCTVADVFRYMAREVDGSGNPTGAYEYGTGTYSAANTITRTAVIESSNADAAVSWGAGTKIIDIVSWVDAILGQNVDSLGGAGNPGAPFISATAPVDPEADPIWCDLSGRMYVWDGTVWFEVSGRPGTDGAPGTNGTNGTNGATGVGVPAGGTAGQVLQKVNSTDFNTEWATPSGGGSPGGTTGQVQYNNAGALGGAAHVAIGAEGNLILSALAAKPTEPPADTIQVYGRDRAGASFIDVQRPSGRDFPLQPHFGVNRIGLWAPSTTTAVAILGLPRTAVGTISHPTLAATNLSTSIARWRNTSAATANSVADERASATRIWRGNAAGLGGWTYINRISLALLPALSRAFFGCLASTAALSTTQDPNALTNCIGIGFVEGTDTNWQVLRNDASGAAVKTDLGASFPVSSLTNVYTLFIACPPNGSSIWVRVVEEVSGAVFEQEFTTDIPAATTFLSVRNYMNNGGTASACAYECSGVYLETDY